MGRVYKPLALDFRTPARFLTWLLEHHANPTTLVVCAERDAFLDSLEEACMNGEHSDAPSTHSSRLLVPRLHLIAISQQIRVAFASSIPHLRAYLAALRLSELSKNPPEMTKMRERAPIVAIWGLVALHRSTMEHSAQGISRSMAAAVEAANVQGQQLVLAEGWAGMESREEGEEAEREGQFTSSVNPWREQVPLLSGSVRFGGDEKDWAARTIEVGAVVSAWCGFAKSSNDQISAADDLAD